MDYAMRIGVASEAKPGERRVALVPRDVASLAGDGHEVIVQSGAGSRVRLDDDAYRDAGARIAGLDELWDCELVVKVKELQAVEIPRLARGQTVFGYHHLTGHPEHARRVSESGITALAWEAVRGADGGLPLLAPMSIVAGLMSIDVATRFLGRVPRRVLVLGAGFCGGAAAEAARLAGAEVHVLRRATATAEAVERLALQSDLVIGAAFTAGERTPKLLPRPLVARMKRGSMIVDIAIEEGGVAETSRQTSHENPTYIEEGVIHYAVPNMPSAVPGEATEAISAAVIPYARTIARKGVARALREDAGLLAGLLVWKGSVTHEGIAREAGVPYTPVSALDLR
jgi:alanine dehydrogenase